MLPGHLGHHLPPDNFYSSCGTVRRERVVRIFYLHSLKAAFLCKNSSVRSRNIHSGFGGCYECRLGESLKVEQPENSGR